MLTRVVFMAFSEVFVSLAFFHKVFVVGSRVNLY